MTHLSHERILDRYQFSSPFHGSLCIRRPDFRAVSATHPFWVRQKSPKNRENRPALRGTFAVFSGDDRGRQTAAAGQRHPAHPEKSAGFQMSYRGKGMQSSWKCLPCACDGGTDSAARRSAARQPVGSAAVTSRSRSICQIYYERGARRESAARDRPHCGWQTPSGGGGLVAWPRRPRAAEE